MVFIFTVMIGVGCKAAKPTNSGDAKKPSRIEMTERLIYLKGWKIIGEGKQNAAAIIFEGSEVELLPREKYSGKLVHIFGVWKEATKSFEDLLVEDQGAGPELSGYIQVDKLELIE